MKKFGLILMCIMMAVLSACSGGTTAKELNMTELAEKLKTSGAFEQNISSTMAQVKAEKAVKRYGADSADVQDAVYYTCVGATAAEILIFQCTDEAAAKRVYALADTHLTDLQNTYQSYAPAEAQKVANAVKQQYGKYVIVVVSSNADTVKSVIAEETK